MTDYDVLDNDIVETLREDAVTYAALMGGSISDSLRLAADEIERLTADRDALREYAKHSEGCSAVFGDQYRCRCGFRDIAAIAAQEKP